MRHHQIINNEKGTEKKNINHENDIPFQSIHVQREELINVLFHSSGAF